MVSGCSRREKEKEAEKGWNRTVLDSRQEKGRKDLWPSSHDWTVVKHYFTIERAMGAISPDLLKGEKVEGKGVRHSIDQNVRKGFPVTWEKGWAKTLRP